MLIAGLGLAALAPVFGVIGLAIRLDSEGPILYRATRAGRAGRNFTMYKFRTMRAGPRPQGARITHHGDDRITRVGHVLRRTRLDELPQLWNVLIGDMSLVGPRPEDPHYVELYDTRQRRVLAARPGVTSLASLRFRDEQTLLVGAGWERIYVEQVMPAKLDIDLAYVEHRSLAADLRIMVATVLLPIGLDRWAERVLAPIDRWIAARPLAVPA